MAVKAWEDMTPAEQENQRKYIKAKVDEGGGVGEWAKTYASDAGFDVNIPIKDTSAITSAYVNKDQFHGYESIEAYNKATDLYTGAPTAPPAPSAPRVDAGALTDVGGMAVLKDVPMVQPTIRPTTVPSVQPMAQPVTPQEEAFNYNSILDFIRMGSDAQKEQAAVRIKQSMANALFGAREEGIAAGEQFAAEKRATESRGIMMARRLKEQLAAGGVTGLEAGKFMKSQVAATTGAVAEVGQRETADILGRNRLINQIKLASEDELTSILAGIDANEFASIVGQLNKDREFALASEEHKMGMLTADLRNQMLLMDLESYPETKAKEMEALQVSIDAGKLSIEDATYQLDQIKDPDSVFNQMKDLELRLTEMDLTTVDLQQRQLIKNILSKAGGTTISIDPNADQKARILLKSLLLEEEDLDRALQGDDFVSKYELELWIEEATEYNYMNADMKNTEFVQRLKDKGLYSAAVKKLDILKYEQPHSGTQR